MKSLNFYLVSALLVAASQAQAQQVASTAQPTAQPSVAVQLAGSQAPAETPQLLTLTLPYSVVPTDSRATADTQVLLWQALPQGAQYQPGSSQLNGQPMTDPVRGPSGKLYWTLPARTDGVLSLQVSMPPSQQVTLPLPGLQRLDPQPDGSVRYLPISGQLLMSDLIQAQPFKAAETVRENAGQIKLPPNGAVYRSRDKITVVVESPLGAAPVPLVNGQPVRAEQVGSTTTDPQKGIQRLEYYGVPIHAGVNHITLGRDDVTVSLAGATSQVDIEPLNVVADGVTPIRLKIRTRDALGLLTNDAVLTLQSNLEPAQPDANTSESGYQVALKGGEGLLELLPQSTPTVLHLDIAVNNKIVSHEIDIRPDQHAVGVGMVSATLGFPGTGDISDNFTVQARAYYEGPLAGGKLYFAADKDGLPSTTTTLPTNDRFVNYGDSSVETVPLQGVDSAALIYDHPRFRVAYRLTTLPLSVLPLSSQITALTVESKTNPALSGFVAWVPGGQINDEHIIPDGTRLLRLRPNLEFGSQVLTLVTLDRVSGAELSRVQLFEGADYSIDPVTGIVTLSHALDRIDGQLNTLYISASYRVAARDDRHIAYGVQLAQRGELGTGRYELGAALASLDDTITYGVAAKYTDIQFDAGVSVLYSDGVLATAHLNSKQERQGGNFSVRYQSDSYTGLGIGSNGFSVSGRYDWQLTSVLGARLEGEYGPQSFIANSNGYVGLLGTYKLAPWTLGAGLRYGFGEQNGVGITGMVGYAQEPFSAEISHTLPITGTLDPTTDLRFSYHLNQWTSLNLRDIYDWNTGNTGAVSVNTTLGNTNYIVAYETANSSGQENRARFGVGTTLPLNDRLNLGLRGAYLRNLQSSTNEFTAGADLHYTADTLQAGLGADISYRSDTGTVTVVHGGVSGDVSSDLNLAADLTSELGARQGLKFGVGYAYRGPLLSSLGYVRYLSGSLASNNANISAGLAAEYRQPTFAVRAGVDGRMLLDDHDTLTYQPYLGGNVYFADRFSVGAWGRALVQPATSYTLYGYGLEAGIKAIPGLWLTAGYNFKGFGGIPTAGMYTNQGLYLRLDMTLDETLNGAKK